MSDSQIFLDTLDRFERQVQACQDRHNLIYLFCLQVIPFLRTSPLLDSLRKKWEKDYLQLLSQCESLDKIALQEVKQVFFRLKNSLEKTPPIIWGKVAHIEKILSGDPVVGFSSWPLYRVVYFELKKLLQMLLEIGNVKICKEYATLRPIEKLVISDDGKKELIEEQIIEVFTFAPTAEKACRASQVMLCDKNQNTAIVWRYFEAAIWYWNTSSDYFEKTSDLLIQCDKNPFPALSQKAAWLEIADCKNSKRQEDPPLIFTDQLFKEGFRILVNEIRIFASQGYRLDECREDLFAKVIVELQLDENQLWVLVHIDRQQTQRYYLKRFNDGAIDSSGPYEFVRQLLEKHPEGGDVQVALLKKFDSIPKLIGHLNLTPSLRELFFGKSRGTHIHFKGAQIAIDRDEKCRLLFQELSIAYRKSDCQEDADF